jgi:hypothetical protein
MKTLMFALILSLITIISYAPPTALLTDKQYKEMQQLIKLSEAAHPQMRELMCPLLDELKASIPVVFNDITY